jgi:hypothetical protein
MTTRTIILAAVSIVIVVFVLCFGILEIASAQETHPDVPLEKQGSIYFLSCQPVEPIDKMNQMCAVRTDQTAPVELGCIDHTDLSVAVIEVTVARTPHEDGFIRCYATDTEGNISDISENAGVADFTPPGRPHAK